MFLKGFNRQDVTKFCKAGKVQNGVALDKLLSVIFSVNHDEKSNRRESKILWSVSMRVSRQPGKLSPVCGWLLDKTMLNDT